MTVRRHNASFAWLAYCVESRYLGMWEVAIDGVKKGVQCP